MTPAFKEKHDRLTPQQKRVVAVIAQGNYQIKDIAERLGSDAKPIKVGLRCIYHQFGLKESGSENRKMTKLAILLHREMGGSLVEPLSPHERDRRRALFTNKEFEALSLLARGLCNREIAQELHTTEQVVKNLFVHIFRAAEMQDRTHVAIWALTSFFSDENVERPPAAEEELVAVSAS